MSQSLTEERKNVPFDIRDLSVYIYESEENLKKVTEAYRILNEDPILKNNFAELGKGRIEQFKMFAEKNKRMHELFNLTEGNVVSILHHFGNQLPGSLSTYMFIPYIRYMGTDEQVEKWLEKALRMEVIGTYAQTELGHGSDVRSLETTATFDPATDEFVINSPTLTSTKFWPGDLGLCANHVVCFAQLILNGEKKGVHGFIVQIRDLETNQLLPGIDAGDLGEKVGFNTKDNGYCRFNNIRIPRDNMLMRYVKVSKKGEYKRRGDERIGYAIMMQVRDMLSHTAWRMLSYAIIISTRYSLVRTQFQNDDGVERKVMDYQLQQDKLIPLIAATYAMHAGAKKVSQMTQQNIRNIQEREDFSMMKDLHATLCGTKAFYSYEADAGINKARLACGGHGYSSYSGFTALWREFSPTPTYEGENTVMALQTARYLLNCLEKVRKGSQLHDNADYLKNLKEILSIQKCSAKKPNDFDLDLVLTTLQANAAYIIYGASRRMMSGFKEVGLKEAWDRKAGLILFEAAKAHMNVYTYRAFYDRINNEVKSPALKASLLRLCLLYGVHKLLEQPLGLMESEYFSSKQFTLLRKRKEDLLEQIRPDVIGLVDAFAIPDNSLRSVLGLYDGNVYETMMKMVREVNDFNHYDWTETWQKHIKTLRDVKRPSPKL